MPLDRSRLTKEERDELGYALFDRKKRLEARRDRNINAHDVSDTKWRLFVVEQLLVELDNG